MIAIGLFILPILLYAEGDKPSHNWHSPSEVVKKVKKKFSDINSYTSNFKITTTEGKTTRVLTGTSLYKKPGKIRYDFNQPEGDAIVSDGKTLWIYIKRLGAVGKQDLEIDKKNSSGAIFTSSSPEGLNRLFRKYHYKFDSTTQPRKIDEKDATEYFVLALDQREKIGGFEKMTLYIDSNTYLVRRATAYDGRGKETNINFSNIDLNPTIEDGLFNFHISGNAKIVNNPLVSED
ncbi:outer membrane lipoprotein carrier protein LolA [Leptospira sp. GIMC2001]|nr:outer membrane lipoprotein carrier protein LolA [Leptospira sp. GIMC2001]WCL51373.1 outer membrane lipoprotein carrier protein LolA [Leptospira sp. GIMC2001]